MANRSESDLKSMALGEHLEELRKRLFRAVLVLAVAFALALPFQDSLLLLISGPHRDAMRRLGQISEAKLLAEGLAKADQQLQDLPAEIKALSFSQADELRTLTDSYAELRSKYRDDQRLLPVLDHLDQRLNTLERHSRDGVRYLRLQDRVEEITKRTDRLKDLPSETTSHLEGSQESLIAMQATLDGFAAAVGETGASPDWSGLDGVLQDLETVRTRIRRLEETDFRKVQLKALRYTDPFFSSLKVCFLVGLLFAVPWFVIEMWLFISAGLYTFERKAVFPFIPFSMIALAIGVVFGYSVLVPVGLGYLGGYGSADVIEPSFTLREYLSLVVTLLLAMGLIFQLPLVLVFLTRAGFVKVETLRRSRRICILSGVVASALLTPPDVITQLMMAGPLIVLYEIGILASVYSLKQKKKKSGGEPEQASESEPGEETKS